MSDDSLEIALLLIASTRAALLNGVKHYDQSGRLLTTETDILTAMKAGPIELDETRRVQRTTTERELEALRRVYQRK